MAPNPRVAKAFRAMREIGIIEEKVKPVLKNLLKLYDKNWELIEEENYRALADAIFDQEDALAVEQKKRHENTHEMDEEAQVQEEPERPLKRLRLRPQEGHVSPSFGNSSPSLGGTSLKQPKTEDTELPETCPPQSNAENVRAGSPPVSPLPLVRNKGKQPVLPTPLSVQERVEPSQPGAADRTQSFPTRRTESDSLSHPRCLRDKGKELLSLQIAPIDKKSSSERSPHAVRLKEPKVEPANVLLPKQRVHDPRALIKPKDEPFTGDLPLFEVPIAAIRQDSLSKENSSSGNGSIREADGPEPLVVDEPSSNLEIANVVDETSSNLEIASSPFVEVKISLSCNSALGRPDFHMLGSDAVLEMETIDVTPAVELLKESNAMDAMGAKGKPFGPSNGSISSIPTLQPSSNGLDDYTGTGRNTTEKSIGNDKEMEQNGIEHINSHSLAHRCQLTPDDVRSLRDVNDVAKGQERVVISIINDVNDERPPSFHYIPLNVAFQNAYVNFTLARIGENCCSMCFGDCLSSSTPCACANETGGDFAYTLEGLVKEDFLDESISMNRDPQKHCLFYCKECPLERSKNEDILEPCKGHLVRRFIKECWWKCGCSKQCGNRVVQRGINCNLQVFMTPEGKGWGLRTLEDLPKGAFVCEYVGEILTNSELYERVSPSPNIEEHAYPVLLDADWGSEGVLKDEEALCLDATFYGNVARFINHRCFDSNLVEIPVEVETPDHHYYHLAFFTTRKVKAMEELTWDYGIDFDDHDHPVKAFKCRCGSKFCRNIKRSSRSRSAASRR